MVNSESLMHSIVLSLKPVPRDGWEALLLNPEVLAQQVSSFTVTGLELLPLSATGLHPVRWHEGQGNTQCFNPKATSPPWRVSLVRS